VVQRAIHCAVCWCVGFTEFVTGGSRCYCTALALSCQVATWQLNTVVCFIYRDNKNKAHFPFTHFEGIWGMEF